MTNNEDRQQEFNAFARNDLMHSLKVTEEKGHLHVQCRNI